MKKIILSILSMILIFVLLGCLIACDGAANDNKNGQNDQTEQNADNEKNEENEENEEKTPCELLNELSNQSYKKVKLNITTTTNSFELKASYVLTDVSVEYSVEQLNLLPVDGNLENASPNDKKTVSGTATVENGKITKVDHEDVTIPSYTELKGGFDFREAYFKNAQADNGKFTADVVLVSDFLGTEKTVNDMKLVVEYDSSAIQKMTMTYQTANATVSTVYEFTK